MACAKSSVYVKRSFQSGCTFVKDVVIGCQEDIETAVGKISGKSIGSTETGLTAVWFTSKGKFHIGYGYVSILYLFCDMLEIRRKIVCVVVFCCVFYLLGMHHYISDYADLDCV